MIYCTSADANKKLQHIELTEISDPNNVEVTTFCEDITELMDARFRAVGISTPITDTTLLKVVRPICVNGVTAEILRSLEIEPENSVVRQTLFEDAMKAIEKTPAILETGSTPADSPAGLTGVTQPFQRNVKAW